MKLVSDRYTVRTKAKNEGYVYNPPGTVIDYPDANGKEKLDRGLARRPGAKPKPAELDVGTDQESSSGGPGAEKQPSADAPGK